MESPSTLQARRRHSSTDPAMTRQGTAAQAEAVHWVQERETALPC
jgi:hypothetical protein